ncbi:MAG: hypothetical protein ABIH67_04655 [Candidatus Uhrbacteria bacterium]
MRKYTKAEESTLRNLQILFGLLVAVIAVWLMIWMRSLGQFGFSGIMLLLCTAGFGAGVLCFYRWLDQLEPGRTQLVMTVILLILVVPIWSVWSKTGDSTDKPVDTSDDQDEDTDVAAARQTITVGDMTLFVPPGPDPVDTPSGLMDLIEQGQQLLHNTPLYERNAPECGGSKDRCRDLLLAVASTAGELRVVTAKEIGLQNNHRKWPIWDCDTDGFEVQALVAFNGVNTNLEITVPDGWAVVGNQYNVYQNNQRVPGIYVPYNRGLDTPEVRQAGLQHLAEVSWNVWTDFRDRKVPSKHVPGALITDIIPPEMLVTIVLVENTDADKFEWCEEDNACQLESLNNALTLIGANGADAFKYRFSSAGAGGLAQIWSKTYGGLRNQYPRAGLPKDFSGVIRHEVAIATALCHFDAELQKVSDQRIVFYRDHPEALRQYLAAAYNGNAARINRVINKHGAQWRDGRNLCTPKNCETRTYLEKYDFVWRVVFEEGLDPSVLETGFYASGDDSAN